MKSLKLLLVVIIAIIILFFAVIVTNYIDRSRVSTNHEPKCCIKIISKDGSKITYYGLGYKVIRYVGISPNEPYENNIGAKIGSWFINFEKPKVDESNNYKIIDKTENINDLVFAQVLENFYNDDKFSYYWSCQKNEYIIVRYEDGKEEKVSDALKNNKISINDLDRFNIKYYKESN